MENFICNYSLNYLQDEISNNAKAHNNINITEVASRVTITTKTYQIIEQ